MSALTAVLFALALAPSAAHASSADPFPAEDVSGCQQNQECLKTYAEHRKLATAEWNAKAYADLVARYNQITGGYVSEDKKKVKGEGGPAAATLMRISTDAKDWQSRYTEYGNGGISGGDCRIKPGDSWSYINQMVACQMNALIRGRQESEKLFKEIEAVKNRKLFQAMVTRKVDHLFPSPMGDKKFAVSDVIYVYLGYDARKFISDKWDYLDGVCKGKQGKDASAVQADANKFLNSGEAGGAFPDKKDVCKGDLWQEKDKFNHDLKQESKLLKKQPSNVFDKSGNFAALDAADSIGGIQVAQSAVGRRDAAVTHPLPPQPVVTQVDMSKFVSALTTTQQSVDLSLKGLSEQELKLKALKPNDQVTAALGKVTTAEAALTKVQKDIAAALNNPSQAGVDAANAGYANAHADEALKAALALTTVNAVDSKVSDAAMQSLGQLAQYKGNLSGKEARSRLFDPRTAALDQDYKNLKGQPLQGGEAQARDAVTAELTRRVKANCGRAGLPWKLMGDFLNDNPELKKCVPSAGGGSRVASRSRRPAAAAAVGGIPAYDAKRQGVGGSLRSVTLDGKSYASGERLSGMSSETVDSIHKVNGGTAVITLENGLDGYVNWKVWVFDDGGKSVRSVAVQEHDGFPSLVQWYSAGSSKPYRTLKVFDASHSSQWDPDHLTIGLEKNSSFSIDDAKGTYVHETNEHASGVRIYLLDEKQTWDGGTNLLPDAQAQQRADEEQQRLKRQQAYIESGDGMHIK